MDGFDVAEHRMRNGFTDPGSTPGISTQHNPERNTAMDAPARTHIVSPADPIREHLAAIFDRIERLEALVAPLPTRPPVDAGRRSNIFRRLFPGGVAW